VNAVMNLRHIVKFLSRCTAGSFLRKAELRGDSQFLNLVDPRSTGCVSLK
jgi:hypothetical protein